VVDLDADGAPAERSGLDDGRPDAAMTSTTT